MAQHTATIQRARFCAEGLHFSAFHSYSKQYCLHTKSMTMIIWLLISTFIQNIIMIMLFHFRVMGVQSKQEGGEDEQNSLSYPYTSTYDAR